ncbi:proteasome assembly chaperone family protein [Natronomonas marina]|jgi:uncharacterized protein|uniref:proteasome assembly chaperone family protein n=1 Tax=Natronomonas marina TaxID=2961939 RepID=UPI0020C93F31|nr:PAC2 family protein [Natronomonas marina]
MAQEPSFEVALTEDTVQGGKLLVGMAGVGVAGLTATDYVVTHAETNQIGHVKTQNLPDITPFTEGQPRHPIRLYDAIDVDVTVLISEVFLPVWVADPLTDAVLEWTDGHGIEEITILYGAPFPHSEDEHLVFHVGTEAYRAEHFPSEEPDIGPLAGGFFDGVIGELLIRSLDGEAPPTGALITPTHLPGPDFDAAIRLLDTLEPVYGIEVDEAELQERAEQMEQYYEELAQRMQALQDGAQAQEGQEYPNNRMYM